MNRRSVFLSILTLVTAATTGYAAVKVVPELQAMNKAKADYYTAQQWAVDAKTEYESSKSKFASERTFDVSYTDLEKISRLLRAVCGITVVDVHTVDAENGFVPKGEWLASDKPAGLIFHLKVENMDNALKVVTKLQLPVASFTGYDGDMYLTILSGEEKVGGK